MTDTADQNERQKTSGTIDTCDYYIYCTFDICSQSSTYCIYGIDTGVWCIYRTFYRMLSASGC